MEHCLRFDERKATQAACAFLRLAGGRLAYVKLIKLLYMLDRKSLLERGRTTTGDHYYSMKHGPVLSEVYDLITDPPRPAEEGMWNHHISSPAQFFVSLVSDPGTDALSEAEEECIEAIWKEFGHYRPWQLVDHLHDTLPEWSRVESGRVPLRYRDILRTAMSEQDAKAIEEEIASVSADHRLLCAR